jgi:hypothetical protein
MQEDSTRRGYPVWRIADGKSASSCKTFQVSRDHRQFFDKKCRAITRLVAGHGGDSCREDQNCKRLTLPSATPQKYRGKGERVPIEGERELRRHVDVQDRDVWESQRGIWWTVLGSNLRFADQDCHRSILMRDPKSSRPDPYSQAIKE